MEPEFKDGEIIIIEPGVMVEDGCYVIADHEGQYIFRQLILDNKNCYLKPLNEQYETIVIPGINVIRGRIISKSNGRGRQCKNYI